MDTNRSFPELLGHFDQPKHVISPDFDWDEAACGASTFEPGAAELKTVGDATVVDLDRPQPPARVRGADWVLQWAGAVMVLAIAVGVLTDFASGVAFEQTLRAAARAGAIEATLPKATHASVIATVERRLAAYPELVKHTRVTLMQNGAPVNGRFVAGSGDQFSVTIATPASAMRSDLMRIITRRGVDRQIVVEAESGVPGRKLRPHLAFSP